MQKFRVQGSGRIKRLMICIAIIAALIVVCFASGILPTGDDAIITDGVMTVDISSAQDGFVLVSATSDCESLKLRMTCTGFTYTYDLNALGEAETFPLQMGSGEYTCALYKNVGGNKYSKCAEVRFSADLTSEEAAFTCPNQYVNYTSDSPAVAKSGELCAGLDSDSEKVEAVTDFMTGGFAFDYVKAITIKENYLSDIDGCYNSRLGCYNSRLGLCQDLAAVTACMLRSQGIPTQLVIGYAGDTYHAWNMVCIDGEYVRIDITASLIGMSSDIEYIAERIY